MSDENVQKLRLKPKLAAEAATTPQPAAAAPAPAPTPATEPEKPAPAPVEEQRSFRLKPKLTAEPAAVAAPAAHAAPVEPPAPPAVGNFPVPTSPPPAADAPSLINSNLPPESTEDLSAQEFAAPSENPPVIGTPDEPVPAPDYVDPDDPSGPTDPESRRALTARPFPPPPANFPAPTVDGKKTVPPWTRGGKPGAAPKKKSPLVLVGGVVTVLIVLGGLFIAYRKFTAPLPEPEPRPRVVAPKKQPEPTPEVAAAHTDPAATTTAQDAAHAAHPADPAVKPVEETITPEAEPPPPPSPEFKAWVENLKVGGVRAGTQANTRVFIGGVAYAAGETVNSQLGIIFESYNAETRRLTFVDQHTGAKVDRRN